MKAISTILLTIGCFLCATVCAQSAPEEQVDWPRVFEPDGHSVAMYQPQIDSWKDYSLLTARSAVAVTPQGETQPVYGAMELQAKTETRFADRQARLNDLKITSVRFPAVDEAMAERCEKIVRSIAPRQNSWLMSLDRIVANIERTQQQLRSVAVNLTPPPIHYSEKPAILVIFLGEPKLQPVEGTQLLSAVNTNWDLFLDAKTSSYYMLNGQSWLTTTNLADGPWTPPTSPPADLAKLPTDGNWDEVRKQIPGRPAKRVPVVFVSNEPAELIVTEGPPQMASIPGTSLLHATNTDSDLFGHMSDQGLVYYFLTAGRWFRAAKLTGPWSSATTELPGDFAKIPGDHARAHVLSSVPGTSEADAAVLLASVPRKAAVKISELSVQVSYEGNPKFVLIDESTVYYAVNTPYDVFRVDDKYYCCHQGVWFLAAKPAGPWTVATSVPQALYAIPSTHPKHNVTYVYIYDSTPETVVVGYTPGYTGQYVAFGTVMFGLGYALGHDHDDEYCHCHYHHHPHYYSYGSGARYDYYHGGYYRSAHVYGPYGGAGRSAAYNPATGTYSRGAYRYGPRGGAFAREAYNPYTDRYAARAGASTPYGSWGRSVVAQGDDWVRAGHRSGPGGTVVGLETSEGGALVAGEGPRGRSGAVARDKHGDLYVGKDGNVYKRTEDGQWQNRSGGSWNDVQRPAPRARQSPARPAVQPPARPAVQSPARPTAQRPARPTVQPSARPAAGRSYNVPNRDYRARSQGSSRARTYRSRSSSGGSRGGSRGGRR